jgi:hypothetical protein
VSITQTVSADSNGEMLRKRLNVLTNINRAKHQTRPSGDVRERPPRLLEWLTLTLWLEDSDRRAARAKDKKVLVVDEEEAHVVREIFALAVGRQGRPLGMKAIACRLTDPGVTRRGVRFSTGSVYAVLRSSTCYGHHHFNRRDRRAGASHPPSQCVGIQVPAIINESTFNPVQALLQSRSPKRTTPRVVNGPTFLAGLARCGYCAAVIQNTGKGRRYPYYCCSRKLKEGPSGCRGLRTPMKKLDEIVVGEVARQVLDPNRLAAMLDAYVQSSVAQGTWPRRNARSLAMT